VLFLLLRKTVCLSQLPKRHGFIQPVVSYKRKRSAFHFGRPSTRTTQLLNSSDRNPPFALSAQAIFPSRTRAPTGLQSKQTISRNPSTPTDNTDKAAPQPPYQILNSSSLSHTQDTLSVDQQEPARRLLAPRTNQLQLTPKYNNNSTGTLPLTQVIHEV
jgi:hypothetical protein